MRRLRPAASLVFALLLALTSGAMAVARGQATASGTLVICTGQGVLSVAVDAEGKPLGPAHICPDCALALFAAAAAPLEGSIRPAGAVLALDPPQETSGRTGRGFAAYSARGPPSLS